MNSKLIPIVHTIYLLYYLESRSEREDSDSGKVVSPESMVARF